MSWVALPGSRSFRWRGMRQRGLTLLELVVVLTVLAAVAGILVPMLPNLLRKAHKSVDATQSGELAKALQMYQAQFTSYPDNFDLLTDGTTFPAYLPADGGAFGGFVEAASLTADEVKALRRVGIQSVQKLAADRTPNGFHPTRNPYAGSITTDAVSLDSAGTTTPTVKFAVIDPKNTGATSYAAILAANPSFLQTVINADPTARYVVFGVGPRCSMVGQVIQDAPMSTPQKKTFTPDNMYARVGVIFKVSGVEVERSERARFVAAVALEDDELETTEKDVTGFYEVSADPRN
ncbi:MAG: prepilin-type N-terminal cleavage/methylation domain-containing protein [Planctomycetaceae bacterium]|nr:prepilin-type N-terminal cleavage/methylation domain-containing protein [Planctomycetaceae bacterium]